MGTSSSLVPSDCVTMLGCTLSNNTAVDGCGGAVHIGMRDANSSPPSAWLSWRALMQGGSMANNEARHGGAICVEAASVSSHVSLFGLSMSGNEALQDGGAAHVATDCQAAVSFSTVSFTGNKAREGNGGAINVALIGIANTTCARANVALSGGRLDGNAAVSSRGGAFHMSSGAAALLTDVALERNSAALGGGVAGSGCGWLELQVGFARNA